jgi:hypothetical protein
VFRAGDTHLTTGAHLLPGKRHSAPQGPVAEPGSSEKIGACKLAELPSTLEPIPTFVKALNNTRTAVGARHSCRGAVSAVVIVLIDDNIRVHSLPPPCLEAHLGRRSTRDDGGLCVRSVMKA